MSIYRTVTDGLRTLFRREHANRELEEELRGYIEAAVKEKMRRGMSQPEALRAARLEIGGVEATKEIVRSAGWESFVDTCWRDLRFAARVLRKNPGFTAVAVLTLALGIGASTAIFSVVDAVLLRPLPYPNPQQIVRVWEQSPDGHRMNLADPNFNDFRSQNKTFGSLAEYSYGLSSVSGGSEPVRINIAIVSSDFFNALSVAPFRGRALAPEEQRLHGAPAAIVSYAYWQRYLGGAEDLSSFHLTMDGGSYPVIGVMPAGFDFPPGVAVWVPGKFGTDTSRTGHNSNAVGRLRDGVTLAQARADLSTIGRRIHDQYGKEVGLLTDAVVIPLADAMVGDVRTALLTLLGAVGLLLLVACTNVAGLLLARTSARSKELAVRSALGAGRGRLIQQFLAESLALALAGGAAGILLATWAVRILPAVLPVDLPRRDGISINVAVLLFGLVAIVAVAISLGLFAAWRAAAGDVQEALTAGSRSHTGSGAGQRLRGFLVVGEISMTLVILIGAGLLGRSFLRLTSTNPGFRPENLITMEFSPPTPWDFAIDQANLTHQIQQMDTIVTRLRAIPGTDSVGLVGALPVAAGDDLADGRFLLLKGQKSPATFQEWANMALNHDLLGNDAEYCVASESYFRALGIPLLRGRLFADQDVADAPHVAVISQALAHEQWPNEDPIGQQINFGNMDGIVDKPLTIVGIVGDVRATGLDRPPTPIVYVDYRQRGMNANSSPTILVRSAAPTGEIISAARGIFREVAPDVPVKFSTFEAEMGGWLSQRRFLLLLVGLFAAAALSLAAVGIYGVVAFSVERRTQEIGVRMALGARQDTILRMVLGEGAHMAALAVVIGIAASLAITRLISSLLFDVSATDPLTFVGVAALLSGVALFASYIPARRAMRVDPMVALRYE